MQRVIERSPQIIGYAVNTPVMLIDDCRFAILVCANFGIRAYHILRKCLKKLVARHLRTPVNY